MEVLKSVALGALVASSAAAQISVVSNFDPANRGSFVAIAYQPSTAEVYAYPEFGGFIDVYSVSGTLLRTVPVPGGASNDIDLEFAAASITIGNTVIPKGTLLVLNGENSGNETLFALDAAGQILASQALSIAGQSVGFTQSHATGQLFVADWASDVVREMNPASGDEIRSFPITPAGSPAFDMYFGDMEALQGTATLFLVSSAQNVIRELTTAGVFVRDISLQSLGVSSMSGIAFDDQRGEAWICGTNGFIYRLSGFPSDSTDCPANWNGDTSVDGDDVILFFLEWDAGEADFNEDGGTDGDDVIAFFTRWDSGC